MTSPLRKHNNLTQRLITGILGAAAIITLAVISATMQSLAMSLVIAREDGRLKRGRGTPMPAWVFIAGRLLHSGVQVLTTNVRLRALVFTVNFLAVLGLWLVVLSSR